MTEFRAGAASLPLEPPLGLPDGRVHPPAVERAGLRAAARGRGARARARRHPRRPLRRRRRRDHPPADRAAARPRRRSDGSRPAGDPPQPEPHPPRAAGGRRERGRLRRRRRRDARRRSRRSPACCTTRSSPPARSRPSGSSPPGSSGDRPTSTSPSTAASGRPTASTAARSSGGTRTSSSTTRSRCSRCAGRTSRRSRRSSASAATRSRPATTWTSTRPTSPGRCGTSCARVSGGECIFFQGAAGNVLPKFAFTDTEDEARRMGTRLGLAALEAVADRFSRAGHGRPGGGGLGDADHALPAPLRGRGRRAGARGGRARRWSIPLMPHPPLEEIERQRREYDEALEEARASGDRGKVKLAYYQAAWARRVEAQLRDGTAPTEVRGPVHAVRIGDGVIVTGPGETFTEYGIAVKERSPGTPTLYVGLHERDPRLPADRERVPVRRLRGRVRLQERRPALALRSERRADPRRDRRPARRAPVPGGGAVGRVAGLDARGEVPRARRDAARAPVALRSPRRPS